MEKEPLLKGQIDMLLLAVVARGPAHGYAIIEQLRLRSRGAIELPEGTVYPALYRLEGLSLLKSSEQRVAGRVRRVYRITSAGNGALREREESWKTLVRNIGAVLRPGPVASDA